MHWLLESENRILRELISPKVVKKNIENKGNWSLIKDEVYAFFHQKRFQGQISSPKSAWKSLWYFGEIKALTWYLVSLFLLLPLIPRHVTGGGGGGCCCHRESKGTGHKFKSPLYAVKRFDSDECCCWLNADSRAALFTLTFPKDIPVPPEFPFAHNGKKCRPVAWSKNVDDGGGGVTCWRDKTHHWMPSGTTCRY